MYGEETLFEKQMQDFEAIENNSNKNVDEQETRKELNETGEMSKEDIQPGGEHYGWAKSIEDDVKRIEILTDGKLNFEMMKPFNKYQGPYAKVSIDGKGDSVWDANVPGEKYLYLENRDWVGTAEEIADAIDGKEEAVEKVEKQSRELSQERESKSNDEQVNVKEDVQSDLVDIGKSRLGWAIAEQLKSILDDPTIRGIEDAELNSNAVRLIYHFLENRTEEEAKEAAMAIVDWVEEGFGDPSILESNVEEDIASSEQQRSETNEKKKPPICKKCGKRHWPFQKCKEAKVNENEFKPGDEVVGIYSDQTGVIVREIDRGTPEFERFEEKYEEDYGVPFGEGEKPVEGPFYIVKEDDGDEELYGSNELIKESRIDEKKESIDPLREIWATSSSNVSELSINEQGGEMVGLIEIEPEEFDTVANTLDSLGGIDPELAMAEGQANVTIVITDGKRFIGVDPQGYDYARYKTDIFDSAEEVMDAAKSDEGWSRKSTSPSHYSEGE